MTNPINEISLEHEKIKINVDVDHFTVVLVVVSYLRQKHFTVDLCQAANEKDVLFTAVKDI